MRSSKPHWMPGMKHSLKVFSHHVECLKCSQCSYQTAVFIILVWRADQQRTLHPRLQRPERTHARAEVRQEFYGLGREKKWIADNRPLDAVGCCVAEPPHIIVVAVYWASGGKHQAVPGETRDLQNHHLLSQPTVHLKREKRKSQENMTYTTIHNINCLSTHSLIQSPIYPKFYFFFLHVTCNIRYVSTWWCECMYI